jgi:hypothetical protein
MSTLLTFSPFLAFMAAAWTMGPDAGLVAGLIAAFMLLMYDWRLDPGGEPGAFDLCVFFMFVVLALYDGLGEPLWSPGGVRARVEAGMVLAVLGSIALRRPCTALAMRRRFAKEGWSTPAVLRANEVMSAAWALAFAAMLAGEMAAQSLSSWPPPASLAVMLGALGGAVRFCARYPDRLRGAQAG